MATAPSWRLLDDLLGDREAVRGRFVVDDIVAVSLLSVDVPARAALYLLDDDAGGLTGTLLGAPHERRPRRRHGRTRGYGTKVMGRDSVA